MKFVVGIGIFGAVGTLVACGMLDKKFESQIKNLNHAAGAEQNAQNPDLWNVQCLDGTQELRTTAEVETNVVCEPGPKFVARQKTILSVRVWMSGEGYVDRNCILPQGAAVRFYYNDKIVNENARFVVLYPANILLSKVASACSELLSSTYVESVRFFADHVAYRTYNLTIYGISYPR